MSSIVSEILALIQSIPTPLIVFGMIMALLSVLVPVVLLVLLIRYLRSKNGQQIVAATKSVAESALGKLKETVAENQSE